MPAFSYMASCSIVVSMNVVRIEQYDLVKILNRFVVVAFLRVSKSPSEVCFGITGVESYCSIEVLYRFVVLSFESIDIRPVDVRLNIVGIETDSFIDVLKRRIVITDRFVNFFPKTVNTVVSPKVVSVSSSDIGVDIVRITGVVQSPFRCSLRPRESLCICLHMQSRAVRRSYESDGFTERPDELVDLRRAIAEL